MRKKIETEYNQDLPYEERRKKLFAMQKKLIDYLNYIVATKRISLRGLANIIGYSPSTVLRWLRRDFPMEYDTSITICEILNLDIGEYLDFDESILISESNTAAPKKESTRKISEQAIIDDMICRFNKLSNKNKKEVLRYIELLYINQENQKKKTK